MQLQNEYIASHGIYSKSLDGILLILTLLENELPLHGLCKNLTYISRVPLLTFNGINIVNKPIRDSHKNTFWKV